MPGTRVLLSRLSASALPPDLGRRLSDDGYLLVEGLLDPATVTHVRSEVLRGLADHGWLADGTPPDDGRPGPAPAGPADPAMGDAYAAIQRLESFHRLAFAPGPLRLVATLLGTPVVVHPAKIVRVIWPGLDELVTRPHQDFPYIQGSADTLTAWIPLADCPSQAGSLRVIPGSHRRGVRAVHPVPGAGGFGVDLLPDDAGWVELDFKTGDVLLFHAFTVHAASPHRGDQLRLSVDYRYQSPTEPLTREWLLPHPHPTEPNGWADVTRHWQSRRWVTLPDGVDPPLTDLIPPLPGGTGWVGSLTIPASRFAGTPAGGTGNRSGAHG